MALLVLNPWLHREASFDFHLEPIASLLVLLRPETDGMDGNGPGSAWPAPSENPLEVSVSTSGE